MADPAPDAAPARPRGATLGRTLLLGLAGAGLAALAGARAWAEPTTGGVAASSLPGVTTAATAPAVTSLGLVALAGWGVVLVARGRARRVVTWLVALASLGALVAALLAWREAPADLVVDLADRGRPGESTARTWWAHLGVLGALVAVAAGALGVRGVRRWPEMGSRYDAPATSADGTGPARTAVAPEEQTNLDLWRALDRGDDPTEADDDPPRDGRTGAPDGDRSP